MFSVFFILFVNLSKCQNQQLENSFNSNSGAGSGAVSNSNSSIDSLAGIVTTFGDSDTENNDLSKRQKSVPNQIPTGSREWLQAASDSLVFIIAAPKNCLEAIADLPTSESKNMAALWIRAVFHDAGTWVPGDQKKGGNDGSLVQFLNEPDNAGIKESIATKFQQNRRVVISNADVISLGGLTAVTHCGGPKLGFRSGRADATSPFTSPVGRLPAPNVTLADFRTRASEMGWTDEDIVALVSGSHTMGGVHGANTPQLTDKKFIPFDDTAGIFDNRVFKFTLKGHCPVPIDCEIAKDPVLKPIVERFANDQDAFFKQYQLSFEKLMMQTESKLSDAQDFNVPYHKGLFETEQPIVEGVIIDEPKTKEIPKDGPSGSGARALAGGSCPYYTIIGLLGLTFAL